MITQCVCILREIVVVYRVRRVVVSMHLIRIHLVLSIVDHQASRGFEVGAFLRSLLPVPRHQIGLRVLFFVHPLQPCYLTTTIFTSLTPDN